MTRALMLLGGLIGFMIGLLLALTQTGSWQTALWRGSVAAFLAGVVLRWWARVWVRSLHAEQRERDPLPAGGGAERRL